MKKTKIDHYTDKEALEFHNSNKSGKIEIVSSKPMTTKRDLALAYSPGVAEPCKSIAKRKSDVYKYTSKGKIIGMGGSAGGLLMGAVVNQAPELFLGIIMAVPFVDSLTTNLDHSLPLTVGEFDEFGNAKDNKDHFDYIYSYAPYNNIKKMDYPNILITTSLSDNRVLFDEPAKFTAKLRDYKTDNNLLLLKTEMNAGHGGKSGRDGAIEEIAIDYAFALKIAKKN